jgi:hypothetical protein
MFVGYVDSIGADGRNGSGKGRQRRQRSKLGGVWGMATWSYLVPARSFMIIFRIPPQAI